MASAYSLGSCRSSTRLSRNPNDFFVRRSSRFDCGVYQSNLTGSQSIPVQKKSFVRINNPEEFAKLLVRAYQQRFFGNRDPYVSFLLKPDVSRNVFITEINVAYCVRTTCPDTAILDALTNQCFISPKEADFIFKWWTNALDPI